MVDYMTTIKEEKILVIGDSAICLIGAAAGSDFYIFRNNCEELLNYIRENIGVYGIYIVSRNVIDKCKNISSELNKLDALVVIIDSPETLRKIKPKEYYEELMMKYVGMKINL